MSIRPKIRKNRGRSWNIDICIYDQCKRRGQAYTFDKIIETTHSFLKCVDLIPLGYLICGESRCSIGLQFNSDSLDIATRPFPFSISVIYLIKVKKLVLLQFSWRRWPKPTTETAGKDFRGQGFKCLLSKDFFSAFYIFYNSSGSFYAVILYIFK